MELMDSLLSVMVDGNQTNILRKGFFIEREACDA